MFLNFREYFYFSGFRGKFWKLGIGFKLGILIKEKRKKP